MHPMRQAAIAPALAASLLAPGIAWAVTIDRFDVGSIKLSADQETPSRTGFVQDGSILGGERDVKVQWNPASSAGTTVTAKINYGGSQFMAHGQESGAYGRTTITWDGVDGGSDALAFGLGQNFLAASVTGFNFDLIAADLNGILKLDVYTSHTHWSSVTYHFTQQLAGTHLFLSRTSFAPIGATGVNWAQVNAIVLTIDGWNQDSLDLRIDQFDTTDHTNIPEPFSAGLLIISLSGWAAMARPKRD